MITITEEAYLKHYGTPRHSGRYPWGSGDNPYQDNASFIGMVTELRKEGMTEAERARALGMTTTQLRAKVSIAKNENKQADIAQAQRLKDKGWSKVEIGKRMGGLNESSVRALLAPGAADKAQILDATATMLKNQVDEKGIIDIGSNVERSIPGAVGTEQKLGISRNKFDNAIAKLREEGYKVQYVKVQQLGTGKFTSVKVLTKPDVEYSDVFKNRDKIRQITEHSEDGGRSWNGLRPVESVDSKRVAINYAEDGGDEADGVIYVRPGVDDLSLGNSNYAQVRIGVDGTHYLKGMAMYKPDLPAGVDLMFNTNKSKSEAPGKLDAMKKMETDKDGNIDPYNPFSSVIDRQNGVMNILREEGSWSDWSNTLSSQMLSKQSPTLAKQQLNMTFERKMNDLEDILQLTNPSVRRKLLEAFADGTDSAAVQLKAAALPRQGNHVILPVTSLKPTEIYAPNFKNGERVVLIRFPHGGIFEIPELTVNNRNRDAKKLLGNQAKDAVGINSGVAQRLSGADFDGDTVLVIPNDSGRISNAPALEGLKDFDARRSYPAYEGMPQMKPRTKGIQMGDVSNLITDMTIKGASASELARAVRHSMVVIDAEKHHLNYKQSAIDNAIPALKEKYQGGKRSGASTLISLKKSTTPVPERKMNYKIDPSTGKKIYTETGASYTTKDGKLIIKEDHVRKLAETDDAHTLSSGTPIEKVYADHSNRLKRLANTARKEQVATKNIPYSRSAKEAYSDEVASLNSKLNIALMNSPRERQAQIVGNAVYRAKLQANPDMDDAEKKKLKAQALAEARTRTGADKELVKITPPEWDAIQAGAITPNKLDDILRNTDLDEIKQLATPRSSPAMSTAKIARAKTMASLGYTQSEIAGALGVSVSTVTESISEGG